ncbi:ImmA/IrrE family metallo-endopeptidase [Amycolatopsis aidingensis]|uniref:ImmA/IrrE family metallo-endopeptidase n=1 Tax=Amycolatopsis aidingensis TaxID=2842453 RepID=UPI001C0E744B|nr:ImmA/IrrE family metallo-endopeptidase [Amycolatopsis aidingensis]
MADRKVQRGVAELLTKYGIHTSPTPVEPIARSEGIQVVRAPASGSESGFLLRDAERVVIGINSQTSRRRQRFTIAHELGHWKLHDGRPLIVDHTIRINKRDQVSSAATDYEEIEANAFAAALLMPAELVQAAVDREQKTGIESRDDLIQALAEEFDVSSEAMGYRLINLGVFTS